MTHRRLGAHRLRVVPEQRDPSRRTIPTPGTANPSQSPPSARQAIRMPSADPAVVRPPKSTIAVFLLITGLERTGSTPVKAQRQPGRPSHHFARSSRAIQDVLSLRGLLRVGAGVAELLGTAAELASGAEYDKIVAVGIADPSLSFSTACATRRGIELDRSSRRAWFPARARARVRRPSRSGYRSLRRLGTPQRRGRMIDVGRVHMDTPDGCARRTLTTGVRRCEGQVSPYRRLQASIHGHVAQPASIERFPDGEGQWLVDKNSKFVTESHREREGSDFRALSVWPKCARLG